MSGEYRLESGHNTLGSCCLQLDDLRVAGEVVCDDDIVHSLEGEEVRGNFLPGVLRQGSRDEGFLVWDAVTRALWALLDEFVDVP